MVVFSFHRNFWIALVIPESNCIDMDTYVHFMSVSTNIRALLLMSSDKQQKDHKLTPALNCSINPHLLQKASSFNYHSYYSQTMECGDVIDLGLSLNTVPQETYHTSGQSELLCCFRYNEGGRRKWGYVKVTMDGFVVGRKVCFLDHVGYPTLAHQLEDMFGMQSESGQRLFKTESEFSLVYRDEEGTWRNASDVSWREFIETVERLRITRRNNNLLHI
ncbi:unnamed protein product [Cochlearia groenlandica]